jgi:hypothetical protein
MLHRNLVDKTKTHILCSIHPPSPRKSCRLLDEVENYAGPDKPRMTARRMYFSCWMSNATPRIRNVYFFSSAIMVTRTRLNVTLYVHCLPCYNSESGHVSEIHTTWKKMYSNSDSRQFCNFVILQQPDRGCTNKQLSLINVRLMTFISPSIREIECGADVLGQWIILTPEIHAHNTWKKQYRVVSITFFLLTIWRLMTTLVVVPHL